MPSLILEGGTFRPIFSAGILDALIEHDVMFPYCIGVSAGITNGVSYISKQKRRNMTILEKYRHDNRYVSWRNYLRCRSLFGLDFIFDELPNKLNVFDMKTYREYTGKFLVGVTNANTGKTEYLDGKDLDDKCQMLRATCAIPIFFPAIKVGENKYFDGGICDPIPIKKAISDGNEKHLILLTRPKGFKLGLKKQNIWASRALGRKYPNLVKGFLNRHELYNETVAFCEELERQGKAIILRPTEEQVVENLEKDISRLQYSYNEGYKLGLEKLEEIKALFE